MPKQYIRPAIPTPSVIKAKYQQAKDAYSKLTHTQQLEYDLKMLKKNEKSIKKLGKTKGYDNIDAILHKSLDKYDPTIQTIKHLKYGGKDIISIRINKEQYNPNNRKFTVKDIQKLSDKLSKKLHKKDISGKIMTSLLYGSLNPL